MSIKWISDLRVQWQRHRPKAVTMIFFQVTPKVWSRIYVYQLYGNIETVEIFSSFP